MKSLVINIGRADVTEIEKQVNEKLKTVEKFSSIKMTATSSNTVAVVLYDDSTSTVTKPQVKIVPFSINDTKEAAKVIDKALEGLKVVSVEPTTIIDDNRLIVVYDDKTTNTKDDPSSSDTDQGKKE